MRIPALAAAALAFGTAACGSPEPAEMPDADMDAAASTTRQAIANLQTADGADVGTVTATENANGIALAVNVTGMPVGERGVHVHMTGLCEAPAFASAGSHWNPGGRMHGLEAEDGPHAGDMPNLVVAEGGGGMLEYTLEGGTFSQLLDADGAAFVVHAGPDDQVTDPSGNSGDRIACGVFTEQQSAV